MYFWLTNLSICFFTSAANASWKRNQNLLQSCSYNLKRPYVPHRILPWRWNTCPHTFWRLCTESSDPLTVCSWRSTPGISRTSPWLASRIQTPGEERMQSFLDNFMIRLGFLNTNLLGPSQNNGILVNESNNSGEDHADNEIDCAADDQQWNTAWKRHWIKLGTQCCQACEKHKK